MIVIIIHGPVGLLEQTLTSDITQTVTNDGHLYYKCHGTIVIAMDLKVLIKYDHQKKFCKWINKAFIMVIAKAITNESNKSSLIRTLINHHQRFQ
ncbi:hypothetical protein DERP_001339 [Dermatophagoides pteronyssinus]|uniref:Uncharacterized protein n=1 Tax=Dermatophagoides pteronyssinus TaxID=6956 RepID=A0ABQ8JE81_DERPT|nr:hypothetical protein DERP_001339 [Dermatophagoides pteronyssinus]